MEITEHQANMLRALADKKTLQFREILPEGSSSFAYEYANIHDLGSALLFINSDKYEVRIKPDVIIVNGIEVPAPERGELNLGEDYYIPIPSNEEGWGRLTWCDDQGDRRLLSLGLVHKTPEAAAARGKAMRAHKPG